MKITSRDNHLVRQVKRLLSDASARRSEGFFVIEGARLCYDAALSGVKIKTLLYTAAAEENYPDRLEILRNSAAEIYEISSALSGVIGDTSTPQGVFCICELLDNRTGLDKIEYVVTPKTGYLGLENLQDPANMGAIIRTAEAFGIDGLLLSDGCCDIYNPKVLRGSMGGVFRLPIIDAGSMADTVQRLKSAGMRCYACVTDREALSIRQGGLKGGVCIIGNEGSGLREETIAACSGRITIPMAGNAESLNAAMAAGIVMWEMTNPSSLTDINIKG
ncbi:MAG: RNA methyltransferase [Oscillospiraceae bacterium]|nr:RNA methyltransferase [Oscillospiraceae bacterium]MDD4413486.1 RNA methyltransferase [Oscillospiraceae bacterium]